MENLDSSGGKQWPELAPRLTKFEFSEKHS